jgi:hypothetical protein
MSGGPPRRTTVACDVHVMLHGLSSAAGDRLEAALHAADRRLGVIVGHML